MKFLKFFNKKHLISHPSLKLYLSYLLIENKNLIYLFSCLPFLQLKNLIKKSPYSKRSKAAIDNEVAIAHLDSLLIYHYYIP